jgi:hypothetical protein
VVEHVPAQRPSRWCRSIAQQRPAVRTAPINAEFMLRCSHSRKLERKLHRYLRWSGASRPALASGQHSNYPGEGPSGYRGGIRAGTPRTGDAFVDNQYHDLLRRPGCTAAVFLVGALTTNCFAVLRIESTAKLCYSCTVLSSFSLQLCVCVFLVLAVLHSV